MRSGCCKWMWLAFTLSAAGSAVCGATNEFAAYDEAIRASPRNASLYARRGWALGKSGHLDKAINDFDRAISLNPKYAYAYYIRAKAYEEKGDLGKAIKDLNESIRLNPDDPLARNNRGFILADTGKPDEALADLDEAVRLDPRSDLAYANRAYAHSKKGDYQQAIADYRVAIRLNPNEGRYHNGLAWLLATSPEDSLRDGKKAREEARKACDLFEWKVWYGLGTLAAACAESGDFEHAIDYQKQTIVRLGANRKESADAKHRLQLYREGKPYREPERQ